MLLLIMLPTLTSAQHYENLPVQDYEIEEKSEYNDVELNRKYHTFTRFRNVGLSLLGISAVSLVSGIVMVSTADVVTWEETQKARDINPDTTISDKDAGKMITGVLLIVATIPFTSAGIPITAIGSKKRRGYKYEIRMRGLQVNISKETTGLRLIADLY
jgi:hypothetical protein